MKNLSSKMWNDHISKMNEYQKAGLGFMLVTFYRIKLRAIQMWDEK